MTIALYIAGGIALAGLLGFAVLTITENFVANHQDRVDHVPGVGSDPAEFMRALHGAAGERSTAGNDVALFQNGDDIFPPMLAAIGAATTTVHFVSYIVWRGAIAEQFLAAFCAAAHRGVVVRVVADSEGSSDHFDKHMVERLRSAGCHFAWYRRAHWFDVTKYNRRSHRRILVVDGTVGFTGGVGVADQWMGNAATPEQWRDTHARVTGPAVQSLQAGFTDTWNRCTNELLLHERDYPQLDATDGMTVTAVVSNPSGGTSEAQRVMAACIAAATRTLRITNAYFVPTPAFIQALCDARTRGVAVSIVVPGRRIDQQFVRRASRHTWPKLLAAGVEIHEFQPAMIHAKTLIIDDEVVLVGSINFDPRSFSLNAECGIVVADRGLASGMATVFARDLQRSQRVDASHVTGRSVVTRSLDQIFYWFRAQL
jgi:cardiolipin synthase